MKEFVSKLYKDSVKAYYAAEWSEDVEISLSYAANNLLEALEHLGLTTSEINKLEDEAINEYMSKHNVGSGEIEI